MQVLFLLLVLLIVLVNAIFGLIRGLNRSAVRFGTLVLAAVGAFFLARLLGGVVGERALTAFETSLLSNPEFAAILQNAPEIQQTVVAVVHMLVAPILFLVLYPVLKLVTFIVYRLILGCFMVQGPKNKHARRLGGLFVGILSGLVGAVVFLTPALGYTECVSHALSTIGEGSENSEEDALSSLYSYNEEFLATASDAPLLSTLYETAGARLFRSLTTVTWNEQEVSLEQEMDSILTVGTGMSVLSKTPIHEYGVAEQVMLSRMSKSVSESPMLSSFAVGTLRAASQAWLENRPFIGTERPVSSDNGDVVFNAFLQVFSTETTEVFSDDLSTFSELFALLVEHDMFALLSDASEEGAFVEKLATSSFLDEAEALLSQNARMAPISQSFIDVGMRLLVRELGLPADYLRDHPELMESMAEQIHNSVEEGVINEDALAADLKLLMQEQQINIADSALVLIADGFAELFAAQEPETLTTGQISERLIARLEQADTAAARISTAAADPVK